MKTSKLKLLLPLFFIVFGISTFGSVTLVNYDFNSGTSYSNLVSNTIPNISCSINSIENFATSTGTITGVSSFTTNPNAGNSLMLSTSGGNNTQGFILSLSGTDLSKYCSYQIYFQTLGTTSGAQNFNVSYSTDNINFQLFTRKSASISTTLWNEAIIDLGGISELNSATNIYIKILGSNASGNTSVNIDNLQIAASYINPSTHGIKNFPRGMYVQDFIKFIGDPEGLVVDQHRSILGNSLEEDKLLDYCKKNNFNYLVFYDLSLLRYIYNRNDSRTGISYGEDLCHFLKKAEDYYCITDFGVAGSQTDFFNSEFSENQTPVYNLTSTERTLLSQNSPVRLVEQILPPGDPRIPMVEYFKFLFNITNINTSNASRSTGFTGSIQCSDAHFNVITAENEFWNDRDLNASTDPTGNQCGPEYRDFLKLARGMNDIKRIQENAGNIIYTELYLGFLEDTCSCNWIGLPNCPTNTVAYPIAGGNVSENQYVANTLDPLFDRFLSTYYSMDEFNLYHRSTDPFTNQYYDSKFLSLGRSNPPGSYIQPLFNSESQPSGGGENIMGVWFPGWSDAHGRDVRSFNIFTAEKDFYDQWYADNSIVAKDNPQMPGSSHWFSSTSLIKNTSNPQTFRSNSPVCAGLNSSAVVNFTYQGPINKGERYDFSVTKVGVAYPYVNLINQEWPDYDPNSQSGITLPSVTLNVDNINDYTAHLKIYYNRSPSNCEYEIAIPIKVKTSFSIEANRPTTLCQEDYVVLTASEGATSYSWSSPVSTNSPNGRFGTILDATPNNYIVTCTALGGTCPGTATIPITINKNYTRFHPGNKPELTSMCDPTTSGVLLTAFTLPLNAGCSWTWGDGTTGFPKQISESTFYSGEFIQSTGCKFTDQYNFTMPNLNVAAGESNILCTSNSSVNLIIDNGNIFDNNQVKLYRNGAFITILTIPWTYNATTSGTYTATGYIAGVCITSQPIEVISSTGLVVTSSTVCAGQHPNPPLQCNAKGNTSGITFNWYENGSLIAGANRYFVTVSPTSTSTYSCSVTTSSGCASSASGIITVNQNPLLTSTITQNTCSNICSGQISISAIGGSSFSYDWGIGSPTTSSISNLCAGEYNVVVTNNLGCKSTATPTVLISAGSVCSADLEICTGQKSSDLIRYENYHSGQSVIIHSDLNIDQDFTFENSDVKIDPGVKIIIAAGKRLTIDNSTLEQCSSTWEGIQLGGQGSSLVIRNNSTIKDANIAINAIYGAHLSLTNSSFLNNNFSVKMTSGDYFHTEIFGNLFDFGNQDPKAQTAQAHILGIDASYIKIGKTGEAANLFKHALTAIELSDPVDGIIENNEFTELGQLVMDDNLQWITKGYGIHASSGYLTGMGLKVRGSGTLDDQNNFHDLENTSIAIEKNIDCEIYGNTFNNINGGITVFQSYGKSVNIHDNHFRDYNYGIDMAEMANATISIEHNDFNMEVPAIDTASSIPLLYPVIRRYGFLGIGLQNGDRSTLTYHCHQNWISNTKYCFHVRNVTNVDPEFVQINENQIFYSKPVEKIIGFEKGIWIENSDYVSARSNNLYSNQTTPTNALDAQRLIGIDFAYLQHGLIQENKIINYGHSMAAKGKCSDTHLRCNNFYLFYNGLMCNTSDRPTISEQGDNLGDLAWDNVWDPENSLQFNFKIGGKPFQVIKWDYRSTGTEYEPFPYEQNINPLQVGNADCTPPSLAAIQERNYKYSEAILPNVFDFDPDSLFYEYLANEYYLRGIKVDISLLNLNTPYDALYNAKYYQFSNSNIGKYEDVRKLINDKELAQADLKLQSVIDENYHEVNKKSFFSAYERFINDSGRVDSIDIQSLTNLAYENPLYGGEAVYNARSLLKLYIEDDASSVFRKLKPDFYLNRNAILNLGKESFDLFPNPTSDEFMLSLHAPLSFDGYLILINQLGKQVKVIKLSANSIFEQVNTSDLEPGIYCISVQDGKQNLGKRKIVIIR